MSLYIKDLLSYIGLAMPALIVIINPLSAAAFFVPLTQDVPARKRENIAWKACLTACGVMILFAIFGTFIFRVFNVTIHAFQIAGGIILFGVAMEIRRGMRPEAKLVQRGDDFAISPLAIPMISGPGAITTCLMLAGEAKNFVHLIVLVICIIISLLIMYTALIYSGKLTALLGEGGVRILTRLMGLILAVIAVQFVLNGIKGAIPTIVSLK